MQSTLEKPLVEEVQAPMNTSTPQSKIPPAAKMLRVSVDVSPQVNDRLEILSRRLNVSKADVLRKAFILLNTIVDATDGTDKKFGIANKSQTLETEFVGLW